MRNTTDVASIEDLVQAVRVKRPALSHVLQEYESFPLGQYSDTFLEKKADSIQKRDDLIDVVYSYTKRVLGEKIAQQTKDTLTQFPVVLTANHHGPDFFYVTLQGDILFSLTRNQNTVLPVFAGGIVPLNNIFYARGIQLSRGKEGEDGTFLQVKIPLYSKKDSYKLTYVTPGFTKDMVISALKQAEQLYDIKTISKSELQSIQDVLNTIYLSQNVLDQKTYSNQSTIINNMLWKKLFSKDLQNSLPEMVYLEIEEIVSQLLQKDLHDQQSLIFTLFFNPSVRETLLKTLNGVYGCWNIHNGEENVNSEIAILGGSTVFFSGIDTDGKRVPLKLVHIDAKDFLVPNHASQENMRIPFTPQGILQNLESKHIIPSLFTDFATIAFARGVTCFGGFMQTDYLTNMKKGVVHTLQNSGFLSWAEIIKQVPTENYSSGMTCIVAKYQNTIKPAGTVEIIAKGGLTVEDLEKIKEITVKEANLLGLPGMYPMIYPVEEQDPSLLAITEADIYKTIRHKLVEIEF